MTNKDYDLIAACIGAAQADTNDFKESERLFKAGIDDLTARLILEMQLDNPRFNEAIFNKRVEYWCKEHGGE